MNRRSLLGRALGAALVAVFGRTSEERETPYVSTTDDIRVDPTARPCGDWTNTVCVYETPSHDPVQDFADYMQETGGFISAETVRALGLQTYRLPARIPPGVVWPLPRRDEPGGCLTSPSSR